MNNQDKPKTILEHLGAAYDPTEVEQRWYTFWADGGYFEPSWARGDDPFVIVMPPPNVTGELHMGHALFVTVEDIMIRYQRMRGRPTLWIPGADHAGIAGQWVVEKEIAQDGLTRHDLGRDQFTDEVWEWMDRYQIRIREQLTSLGASSDWTRYRFTMDPGPALAVRTVFKQLYDEGLIYRGERLISWCPRCQTALSDLEVNHEEVDGFLWHILYPFADSEGGIEIATTRPETMLGDTAVAVHPDDDRYKDVVGKHLILPIIGREIPIIADASVDPSFGSGAVKVTPAHDPNDFDIGNRHGLPRVSVMTFDGTMNEAAGPFAGLAIDDARQRAIDELRSEKRLVKTEPHRHAVGTCDRCEAVVEPLISKQWFVRMEPLAKPAIDIVRSGEIRFVPERFAGDYLHWMENVHDWCISRQLWWGHRIPVWYCDDCGLEWSAIELDQSACPNCRSGEVRQDSDVLDTWFSSGLWPFSIFGWPNQTEDLERYYPGSVLETGYDIIFFWVARMIFFGIKFMNEAPFHTVYLHGTVRDADGQRMSKTKGNVLDPTELTAKFGTDALRFTLITASGPGSDVKVGEENVEANRNFANKLFNATKFVLAALETAEIECTENGSPVEPRADAMSLSDKWIVSKLDITIDNVTRLMNEYQFHEAGRALYEFLWSEFCDWYIEAAKTRLRPDSYSGVVPQTLAFVLERSLRLLHPYMPYLTEDLWQRLPHAGDALIVAHWPDRVSRFDDEHDSFELVKEVIRLVRHARAEYHVEPGRKIAAVIYPGESFDAFSSTVSEFQFLARIDPENYGILRGDPVAPPESASIVVGGVSIYLPLAGMVDFAAERARLRRELENARADQRQAQMMLNNEQFVSKAPDHVVAGQRDKMAAATEQIELLRRRLAEIA